MKYIALIMIWLLLNKLLWVLRSQAEVKEEIKIFLKQTNSFPDSLKLL